MEGVVVVLVRARGKQLDSILEHLENKTFSITSRSLYCPTEPPTAAAVVTRVHVTSSGNTQALLVPVFQTLDKLFPGLVSVERQK